MKACDIERGDENTVYEQTVEVPRIATRWHISVWIGLLALTAAVAVTTGLLANALL